MSSAKTPNEPLIFSALETGNIFNMSKKRKSINPINIAGNEKEVKIKTINWPINSSIITSLGSFD